MNEELDGRPLTTQEAMTRVYPDAVKEPCNECPWRRAAMPGYLGPHDADEWLEMAHGETPIACHKTIKVNLSWRGASQCRGAAIFRRNVVKTPRNPTIATGPHDIENVFASNAEFREHHEQ